MGENGDGPQNQTKSAEISIHTFGVTPWVEACFNQTLKSLGLHLYVKRVFPLEPQFD